MYAYGKFKNFIFMCNLYVCVNFWSKIISLLSLTGSPKAFIKYINTHTHHHQCRYTCTYAYIHTHAHMHIH